MRVFDQYISTHAWRKRHSRSVQAGQNMKGLILCLVVIIAVDAVRSQHNPPTRTKKGKRPSRPNDNPDIGLPSGADVPDNRRLKAVSKVAAVNYVDIPPRGATRLTAGTRPNPPAVAHVVPPAATKPGPAPVKRGPPPPNRKPAGRNDNRDRGLPNGRDFPDNGKTRTRSGPPPATHGGRRNDNPDRGLPSGRDFPDAGHFFYAPPVPVTAPPQPIYNCDFNCKFMGYKPVCTVYGNTYDNDCYRKCRNEPRECENECPCNGAGPDPTPVVPGNYFAGPCDYCYSEGPSTVCVDNEENVYNECLARCEGKKVTCTDVCPCN